MQVIGKALGFSPVEDARRAEARGYDGVRVIDHFFSGIPPEAPRAVPHSLVSLAAAAAATERVLLTQTMVAATFRHPVEVAQAVATLDRISDGRAELGLGAGWLEDEHSGLGLSLGSPGNRVDRLAEAAAICRAMFENHGTVSFDGSFFRAHCGAEWPSTPHQPQIMIGAHGARMLRVAAAVADRIDLLEAMSAAGPCFDGVHANSRENLERRMSIATGAKGVADRELRFSATVNLVVASEPHSRDRALQMIAEAAGCTTEIVAADMLRVVTLEDEALDRIGELSELGIDRLHVRPVDELSSHWLDGAVGALQECG
ncbi:LLM class flavin-dependent oxidoreductase [Gemmatimonas sp.]|uniref:LLM class flavin-dependent oxidoreductase n=1 Tax=Gemmatimonas sp. TaxID=1962908 RepID=UPI0035657A0C